MMPVAESTPETTLDSPLSSASLRYSVRAAPAADGPGSRETRPLGLRFAKHTTDGDEGPEETTWGWEE